jgi:hypothetical protein
MHSSNTCDMYEGFCIGCKNTAESFLFLFTVSLHPPPQPALHAPHCLLSLSRFPPTPSCNKRHHTYNYVACSNVNARNSRTSLTSRSYTRCATSYDNEVALRHINVNKHSTMIKQTRSIRLWYSHKENHCSALQPAGCRSNFALAR